MKGTRAKIVFHNLYRTEGMAREGNIDRIGGKGIVLVDPIL